VASRIEKKRILDEFCQVTGYHRKYALRLLNAPLRCPWQGQPRRRGTSYGSQVISVLAAIWKAAGYPWSVRLKALLPLWLRWARRRFRFDGEVERQLLAISPRQIDRRLKERKHQVKRRLYGRTKPGTLLKHHIAIRTDRWDVREPGYSEVDLVAHCGNCAEGEFVHSLNLTDILTTWVETRAVLGKSQTRVGEALEEIRVSLPFTLKGIDSDNGSEFINAHLVGYCNRQRIQFTRGRPYKKDDNAHIEQKNWTHVRKLLGYLRYDTPEVVEAMNALYRGDLRLLQNLFLPSVKLRRKERVGSRIRRYYDAPQTPLQRVEACAGAAPAALAELKRLRDTLDPFELSRSVESELIRIQAMASMSPKPRPGYRAASSFRRPPLWRQARGAAHQHSGAPR
jgi:hypothetical protein